MAKATEKSQEVAPAKGTASSVIPAEFLTEMEMDSGAGVKEMTMDDVAVPYLYILQQGSPQVNPDHEAYIENAKAGMFYNNVTGEVFDGRTTGLTVIPCYYERKYVEWRDRDTGTGGYVQDHDIDSGILSKTRPNQKGQPTLDNGNIIMETAYHYVYMYHPIDQRWEEIIIPMKSTMLKKSRRWNKTLMSTLIPGTAKQAPRWLYPYQLKTVKETKGDQTWSNFEIDRLAETVTVDQYRQAKGFKEAIETGAIKRATETLATPGIPDDDRKAGGNQVDRDKGDMDDDIPF